MGYQVETTFPTISSGSGVSDTIAARHGDFIGLWLPTVTSAAWTLQTAYATAPVSADFLPIVNAPPNSGPLVFWWGVGSLAVALTNVAAEFSALRLVSSLSQTSPRTLAIVFKV